MEIPTGTTFLEEEKLLQSSKWDEDLWDDFLREIEPTAQDTDENAEVLDLESYTCCSSNTCSPTPDDQANQDKNEKTMAVARALKTMEASTLDLDNEKPSTSAAAAAALAAAKARSATRSAHCNINSAPKVDSTSSDNEKETISTTTRKRMSSRRSRDPARVAAQRAAFASDSLDSIRAMRIKQEQLEDDEERKLNAVNADSISANGEENYNGDGYDGDNDDVMEVSDSDDVLEVYTLRFINSEQKKEFEDLRTQARRIIFNRLMSRCTFQNCVSDDFDDIDFPHVRLKALHENVKKYIIKWDVHGRDLNALWENVIQWLTAMKLSSSALVIDDKIVYEVDLDEKYNLIMVEILSSYINFKTEYYEDEIHEGKIRYIVQHLYRMLAAVFSYNCGYIAMTLLRIDIKLHYRFLLDPMFKLCLTDSSLKTQSLELIDYLCFVLCFKRWKRITPLKAEREKINEIAIGKPPNENVNATTDDIIFQRPPQLPKSVPRPRNKFECEFPLICDLIKFAMSRKENGTRTILVNTSPDLEDAIQKYFALYSKYAYRPPNIPMYDQRERPTPITYNIICYQLNMTVVI